ncbi:hypothetical protein LZG04_39320 [Saccharothrix sp. S26]|uniref:hypothetical protein n=1 Tax=Saccharothrix sp. S26 TaxID=2907215 RepID=UPI001F2F7799|nr:hypothetical protein [Saccharothrix sp. S26]MCE7000826.1 hypothetical protein [Saccharothrix sp. S26]
MSGFAELEVGVATTALSTIGEAGTVAADAWRGHRGTIDAKEPAIGTGPLAEAFRSVYDPEPAKQAVDRALGVVPALVSAGREGVAGYVEADRRGAAGFTG